MAWGIIVYESAGRLCPFVMDDSLYEEARKNNSGNGRYFLICKKGISDEDIENICKKVTNLAERLNGGKFSSDKAKKRLETILNHKSQIF